MDEIKGQIDNVILDNKNREDDTSKEIFKSELKSFMYGFGDCENPDPESMDLLEQYIIEYIQNIPINTYQYQFSLIKEVRKGDLMK